jgi:hypothetical protein
MKRSLLWFFAAAVMGATGTVRATVPCEPTTTYRLQVTSLTVDGAAQPLPAGSYSFFGANRGGGFTGYAGAFVDPDDSTAARRIELVKQQ